jgi:branched-subunit amino acid ABC-type transport system permease component
MSIAPFIVAGVVVGALYGLAATGLVLTYKTSGIFNFAHGAVGAATAFLFYDLRHLRGLPWPIALVLSVFVAAPVLGLGLAAMAARLSGAPTVQRVVATVGVLLVVQGAVQLRYGIVPIPFDTPLPTRSFDIGGTIVGLDQLITIGLAVLALAGLGALFRQTRLGLEMRAVVDNGPLLDLAGGVPARVRALSWMLGASFAGLSGLLLAPTVGLDAVLLTLLVVQAFGAAAVGRFDNVRLAFWGGVAIGVGQYLLRAPAVRGAVPLIDAMAGLDQSFSFLVLFALLLVAGRRFPTFGVTRPARRLRPWPFTVRVAVALGALAAVVAIPFLAPSRAPVLIQGAVFVTIFASLYLLVEISGQVSLAHAAFVAVGATTFAHLTRGAGLPWGVGVLGAVLVAVPLGAVVAVPAIRVSGLYLALATLGFGVLVEQMVYSRPVMFGDLGQRFGSRPRLFGLDSDARYFWLCAALAALALALIVVVRRTRLGRLLNAVADEPVALATFGCSPNVTLVLVFCLAAAMAALGGALSVGVVGSVSASGVSPTALVSFNSLLWVAVLALAGRHPLRAPIVAALAMVVAPSFFSSPNMAQYLTIGFGSAALFASVGSGALGRRLERRRPVDEARIRYSPVAARLRRPAVSAAEATVHA